MPRRLISLMIASYAIAFAFGAMAAIRWPSLMMFAAIVLEKDPLEGLGAVDWRELGIAYGAPYFLSALCFYASAISIGNKVRGSLIWYVMGCAAGFPCVFLVDFETGWWRDPSAGEGAVAGAAAAAVLLGIAAWNLRRRKRKPEVTPEPAESVITQPQLVVAPAPAPKPKCRKPVPAAIARQRALFAADGRRMLERQRRRAAR